MIFYSYKSKNKPGPEVVWRVESHPGEDAKVPNSFQTDAEQSVLPNNGQAPQQGSQGTGDIKQSDLPAATSKNGSKKPSRVHPKRKGGHRGRNKNKKHHVTATKVCLSFMSVYIFLFKDLRPPYSKIDFEYRFYQ